MGPLILVDFAPSRWIQPEHVVRVVAVNGSRCTIRFVDDHSIDVPRPAEDIVAEINDALSAATPTVRDPGGPAL